MSLERIEVTPFVVLVGEILQNRRSGHLTIIRAPTRRVLYWAQGELVLSASSSPADSLGSFLVRHGAVTQDRATQLFGDDPNDVVARVHESGLLDLSSRQTILREWLAAQLMPLFSLDEGTAAFTEDEPVAPDKRVFLQSTAALLIEGVRAITNGLVLRRSLGELKRQIQLARNSRFSIDSLPLTDDERKIANALTEPSSIEGFLKKFSSQSVMVAKVVISMLALGIFSTVEERQAASSASDLADMHRDLELLAAIGASDPRSLRAVALSRQLPSMDHYQVLEAPRAATRAQLIAAAEAMRKRFDPATYPPIVNDSIQAILRRIDQAAETLKDVAHRSAYDKLIHARTGEGAAAIQQRLTQRTVGEQNYAKAKELTIEGDYYGAIVLLKQTVNFIPDHAGAWALLGSCQERNPRWRREAAESFQRALSIDPSNVDAMISLGDLYKSEGMISRAQTCYEDVLKIASDNQQARSRLQALKKR